MAPRPTGLASTRSSASLAGSKYANGRIGCLSSFQFVEGMLVLLSPLLFGGVTRKGAEWVCDSRIVVEKIKREI